MIPSASNVFEGSGGFFLRRYRIRSAMLYAGNKKTISTKALGALILFVFRIVYRYTV